MRARTGVFCCALMPLLIVVSRGYAQTATELRQQIDSAYRSGDDKALLIGLAAMEAIDNEEALNDGEHLVQSQAVHQRPVGVAFLQRYAPAAVLCDLALKLPAFQYCDERRELVRALGQRRSAEVVPALQRFLRDSDQLVAAAAAAGIADQGDKSLIGSLLDPMPSFHDFTEIDGAGDDQIYAFNALGAIRTLCGHEEENNNALRDWLRDNRAALNAEAKYHASSGGRSSASAPSPAGQTNPVPVNGKFFGRGFYYTFYPAEAQDLLASRMHLGQDTDWQKFERGIEQAAALDREIAAQIFGPMHVPYCRLKFATRNTMAADGGVCEGYGGFGGDNRITIDTENISPYSWPILIRHEYVHVLNGFMFDGTPRWLSEGLAVSISESPRHTAWTPQRVARSGVMPLVEQGGITADLNWTNGPSSGGTGEAAQYSLAGLVMDYLRFGDNISWQSTGCLCFLEQWGAACRLNPVWRRFTGERCRRWIESLRSGWGR